MMKRPENSTNREEREEDGIISPKETEIGELMKAVFGYVNLWLGGRKKIPSTVPNVQKSVGSDEFTAQLGRCSSGRR